MRYTIHKWFWAWDFEKEEKWLNEMSAKGLQLVAVGLCKYVFQEAGQGEYTYRLELLGNLPSHAESISYIRFLEETGVEHIGSIMRWVYFRKKAAEGPFELYSDMDSKIKHYKRIITLFLAVTPMNIWAAFLNLSNYLRGGYTAALVFSLLSFSLIFLLGMGTFRVSKKIGILKRDKAFRE